MQRVSEYKGIKLSNIPSVNLREQFYNHYHMVKSKDFAKTIQNWKPGQPIDTPYISWFYWPEQFFTFLTQLSIVGVESYVCSAAHHELGARGLLKANIEQINNPFSKKGKGGTAVKYYKEIPALIPDVLNLHDYDSNLWAEVLIFYKSIRNPLFHGKQLDTKDINDLINIFELLASIYSWIDSWHNPDNIIPGSSWVTQLKRT